MKRALTFLLAVLALILPPAEAVVIKAGMTLNIVVKGDAALTQMVKVQENGTIEYPLYQDVSVVNKTTSELQDILTYKLAKVVETPLVLVSAVTETPISISMLGQVMKPGLITTSPKATLQEALLLAGGPAEQADLQKVKVVRRNQPEEEAGYYDLQRFMNTGDLSLLPPLADGDRVIVLSSKRSKYVKILGAVNKPGFYPLSENASVFDMLYLAGGPAADANLSRVRIMGGGAAPGPAAGKGGGSEGGPGRASGAAGRGLGGADERKADYLLDMQRFIDEGKTENLPYLAPGDVVIVYNKTLTWAKGLDAARDIVTLVTAWFVITQAVK